MPSQTVSSANCQLPPNLETLENMHNAVFPPFRLLYDREYVDSDCDPSLCDASRNVDNTVGTVATNYIICVLGVIYAVLFLRQKQFVWASYFLLTGIGYGVAGIGHVLLETVGDPVFDRAKYAFIPTLLVGGTYYFLIKAFAPSRTQFVRDEHVSL